MSIERDLFRKFINESKTDESIIVAKKLGNGASAYGEEYKPGDYILNMYDGPDALKWDRTAGVNLLETPGLSKEEVEKLGKEKYPHCKLVSTDESVEEKSAKMEILEDFEDTHHEYRGFWFTNDTTDRRLKDFIADAYENGWRLLIVYKEGWEDFSGYHGGDGRHHTMYIGKSTGKYKIPLEIPNRRSRGGQALLTSDKAIESYKRVLREDSVQNEEIVENSYAVVKAIDNGIGKAPTAIDVMKGYVTFDEAQTAINDMSTDQEFADDPTLMLFVAYEKDGKLFNAVTGDIVNIPEEKSEATSYGRTVQFQNIGFGFNVETGSSEDSKNTLSLMGFSSNTESDVEYISNELALDYSLPAEKSKELNDKVVAIKQEVLQELLAISNEFDSKVAEIMEKHGFRKASND